MDNLITEHSLKRRLRKAAYKAGRELYGDDLIFRASTITFRSLRDRVVDLLEQDTDPCVCGLVDDYEYAFTLDGKGIEASGDAISDPKLQHGNVVLLYDPEFGIDVLGVCDFTTEEMYQLIGSHA